VRLFGFPVHVDLSFVLVMGLLGYLSRARTPRDILIWLVVATLSVLSHELGHAVMARAAGARPTVALTGFGGVTTFSPPRELSRFRSLSISLAGPLVGLVIGAVLFAVYRSIGDTLEGDSATRVALIFGMFTCLGWSVLNLLPVLPLDGGQAMRELLPGAPEVRARRAAMVSVGVLVPLFGLAVYLNYLSVALFLLLFGATNLASLRRPAAAPAGQQRPVSPEQSVATLLWQGQPDRARVALASLPEGTPVDLAVHGAVLATTDQPEQGEALLQQELVRRPGDPNVVALLVLTHLLRHNWDAVERDLRGRYATEVPLAVVERAIEEARNTGRPDVAARISALPRSGPQPSSSGPSSSGPSTPEPLS
jgi:Zn-dependent protease